MAAYMCCWQPAAAVSEQWIRNRCRRCLRCRRCRHLGVPRCCRHCCSCCPLQPVAQQCLSPLPSQSELFGLACVLRGGGAGVDPAAEGHNLCGHGRNRELLRGKRRALRNQLQFNWPGRSAACSLFRLAEPAAQPCSHHISQHTHRSQHHGGQARTPLLTNLGSVALVVLPEGLAAVAPLALPLPAGVNNRE